MTNKKILNGAILSAGYTQQKVAEIMGISGSYLNAKINNRTPWAFEEVVQLKSILGLTPEQIDKIWFDPDLVVDEHNHYGYFKHKIRGKWF